MDRYWSTFPGRPMDHVDPRAQMAWQHRSRTPHQHWDYRPSSPSLSSTSTDYQDKAPIMHNRRQRNSTLRSTRSVPALNLIPESCPVHSPMPRGLGDNLRRYGSMYDIRVPSYFPEQLDLSPNLDKKSFHGSVHNFPRFPPSPVIPQPPPSHVLPPHFMPPMARPYLYMYPMGADSYSYRDPYRMPPPNFPNFVSKDGADPYKVFMPNFNPKDISDPYSVDQVCCKGHLIVLWVILSVVTVGVILGIVLGVMLA